MSFQYIRDYYKVPAEIGRRVSYTSDKSIRQGVIVDSRNQYIYIHFDGDKKPSGPFHPTCGIEYFDMGEVPKSTRSQERYRRYKEVADCFRDFRSFLAYEKDEQSARKCGFGNVSQYYDWLKTV